MPLLATARSRDAPAVKELCATVGSRYGKSPYQVALRYLTQLGASFTVEAKSSAHFKENLSLFDFKLSDEELRMLEALNRQPQYEGSITGPDA